jgi:hypothetical protein
MNGGINASGSVNSNSQLNPRSSGGLIASGISQRYSTYSPQISGGCSLSGNVLYFNVITKFVSGGVIINGDSQNYSTRYVISSGGTIASGILEITSVFNPSPSNGAEMAGHGATIDTEYTSGGILASGHFIARNLIDYPSGGLSIGGQSLVVSEHIWIKVDNCGSDLKCGYSNDDQFCAGFDPIQGFGSKLVNPKRKDPTASLISKKSLYGTTAYVPAITFCHQKIRVDAEDMPPKRIITSEVPVETSNDENIQLNMMSMSISMPIAKNEIQSKQPKKVVQKNLNTPQMAALKKLSNSTKKTTFTHEPITKGHKRVQKIQRPRLDAL